MASLLIKGGRVLSPADGIDARLNIRAENRVIQEIAPQVSDSADEIIEAEGQIVSPGFVDLHVHFREPGGEISETIESGLRAAVAGGFTSVCPMPNTRPVNDSPELTRKLVEQANRLGLARLYPIAAVSLGSEGEQLTDFEALIQAGAVAFSDDGKPVKTAALLNRALERAKSLGVPVIDHCEEPAISAGGLMNEGEISKRLKLRGVPNASEDRCVARDIEAAEATGAHLHVAHLSTAGSLDLVRQAKSRGARVTCEVTPHHFTLTDEAVGRYGTHAKMNPPLRSAHDLEAILSGIQDGAVDAIATDHAPHAPEFKAKSISEAPFGITGLETAFGLSMMQLVYSGRIALDQLIVLLSSNPARIINKPLGRVQVGGAADLTIFDPELEWTYRVSQGQSKSHNSPFDGWNFRGAITATIVAGKVVYQRN